MTTLQIFLDETEHYSRDLEIVIEVGSERFQIDDVFFNGQKIIIESSQLDTPTTMGKKGGKIGGLAKVKKGFAMSGKGGRKPLTDEQLSRLPTEKQTAILKRRKRLEQNHAK